MKTFPLPALAAALAAAAAVPFSAPAAATLLLTGGLGFILHADYVLRRRRVQLPRRAPATRAAVIPSPLRRPCECQPLAA